MNFQPRLRGMYLPSQPMRGGRSQMRGSFRHNFLGYRISLASQTEEFWCETCDRGFGSSILLQNHKKEHMKCAIDGCQFVAHPKVVTKHIEMQHSTGLYKRIGNLNNPEDIEKWREERKKRYPTKENMDLKKAQLEAKLQRGEKMGLSSNDRKKKYDHGSNSKRRDNYKQKYTPNLYVKRKSFDSYNDTNQKVKKHELVINIPFNDRKLRPFSGIQSLTESDEDHNELPDKDIPIEDDEFESEIRNSDPTQQLQDNKVTVCSALSSLIMSYGFSDEDGDHHHEQIENNEQRKQNETNISGKKPNYIKNDTLLIGPHKGNSEKQYSIDEKKSSNDLSTEIINELAEVPKNHKNLNSIQSESIEQKEISLDSTGEDSSPEEVHCKLPENFNTRDVYVNNKEIRDPKRKTKMLPMQKRKERKKTKLPSTLLEKLLSTEIRHERNVVLQCVRHTVKNNYFEK